MGQATNKRGVRAKDDTTRASKVQTHTHKQPSPAQKTIQRAILYQASLLALLINGQTYTTCFEPQPAFPTIGFPAF